MELNVTDRKSFENDRFISDAFILKEDQEDTFMLKKVTLRFVNAILDFNPDATEQLDMGEKHVANVENLGDQARKKSGSYIREMNELFDSIKGKFADTSWISGNLNAISKLARETDPFLYQLKDNRLSRFMERIPFISTPLRRYFTRLESRKGEVELLIRHLNRLTTGIEKDGEILQRHKTALLDQCQALVKAIYMGSLINKKLSSAMETDIRDDDPRRNFIENDILQRLRTRLKNLHLQRDLNRACLEAVLIVFGNNAEICKGLVMVRTALVSCYNLGKNTAKTLVRRDITGLALDDDEREENETESPLPAPGLEALSDSHKKIPFLCQSILDFMNRAEPVVRAVLKDIPMLREKTDNAFLRASMANDDITKV